MYHCSSSFFLLSMRKVEPTTLLTQLHLIACRLIITGDSSLKSKWDRLYGEPCQFSLY